MRVFGGPTNPVSEYFVVTDALRNIGGVATAKVLCDKLVADGMARPRAQLWIQRTIEKEFILVGRNWLLSLPVMRD